MRLDMSVNRFAAKPVIESQTASCPATAAVNPREETMKNGLCIVVTALVVVPMLCASQAHGNSSPYVTGTVVAVQRQDESASGGSNPSDAQLASTYYAYEVSVRVDCVIYVGRYETPLSYLPSAFTPHQPIKLRVTKHVMHFELPNGSDMKMEIRSRSSECGNSR
jgi:hypothetical protein